MPTPLLGSDPRQIARYRLDARLGAGGMGIVYLAYTPTGRAVAMKVIKEDLLSTAEARSRFARETQIVQSVPRFCCAEVLDVDVDAPYLVTEFISGQSLAEAVRSPGPLQGGDLEAVCTGVALALWAVHDAGVIHRDFTPANVILSRFGPKIIDFGLAVPAGTDSLVTRPGRLVGTPAFMAPELLRGSEPDAAADVFAWGASMAYASSGHPPWGDGSGDEILARVQRDVPAPEIDGDLHDLVRDALAVDPLDRPSAADLFNRARRISPPPIVLPTPNGQARTGSRMTRADEAAARAQRSLEASRPRRALHEAAIGLALDPENARCVYVQGLAHTQLKDMTAALDSFRLAYELDADNQEIAETFALRTLDAGDVRRAFEVAPGNSVVRKRYVEMLIDGDLPELVRKAWTIDPSHPEVRRRYLDMLLDGGREGIRQAYLAAPDDPAARRAYVRMMLEGGRDEILGAYRMAPDDEVVCNRYLGLLFQTRPLTAAIEEIQAIHAYLPEASRAHAVTLIGAELGSLLNNAHRPFGDIGVSRARLVERSVESALPLASSPAQKAALADIRSRAWNAVEDEDVKMAIGALLAVVTVLIAVLLTRIGWSRWWIVWGSALTVLGFDYALVPVIWSSDMIASRRRRRHRNYPGLPAEPDLA